MLENLGTLSVPHRRTYLNIAETKEENKQLKAEVFDLKSQLFMLKRKLPSILDSKGKDFTEQVNRIHFLLILRSLFKEIEKGQKDDLKAVDIISDFHSIILGYRKFC